ncbi:very short patch repair endonuclease [Streptomyces zhihengii]
MHRLGLRFRLQLRVATRCTADFVLPRYGVAVFVDGCFWHGCPTHGPTVFRGPNASLWTEMVKESSSSPHAASCPAAALRAAATDTSAGNSQVAVSSGATARVHARSRAMPSRAGASPRLRRSSCPTPSRSQPGPTDRARRSVSRRRPVSGSWSSR